MLSKRIISLSFRDKEAAPASGYLAPSSWLFYRYFEFHISANGASIAGAAVSLVIKNLLAHA